jgi:hypothetical protein
VDDTYIYAASLAESIKLWKKEESSWRFHGDLLSAGADHVYQRFGVRAMCVDKDGVYFAPASSNTFSTTGNNNNTEEIGNDNQYRSISNNRMKDAFDGAHGTTIYFWSRKDQHVSRDVVFSGGHKGAWINNLVSDHNKRIYSTANDATVLVWHKKVCLFVHVQLL